MPGLFGRLLLRAFRIYKDHVKRSSGNDVTIRKAEVGGGGRHGGSQSNEGARRHEGAPNEVNR